MVEKEILDQFGLVSIRHWTPGSYSTQYSAYLWNGSTLILKTDDFSSESEAIIYLFKMLKYTLWHEIKGMEK